MTFWIWAAGVVLMSLWLSSQGGAVTWWHYLAISLFGGIWFLISMFINALIIFIKINRQIKEYGKSEVKDKVDDSLESFERIQCLINTNDFLSDLFETKVEISIDSIDQVNDVLLKMVNTLTSREERVLRLRYGLFDIKKLSCKEIADKFEISQETVKRYEKRAIIKMRHPSRFNSIKLLLS